MSKTKTGKRTDALEPEALVVPETRSEKSPRKHPITVSTKKFHARLPICLLGLPIPPPPPRPFLTPVAFGLRISSLSEVNPPEEVPFLIHPLPWDETTHFHPSIPLPVHPLQEEKFNRKFKNRYLNRYCWRMDQSKNHSQHLGVNKLGKNIRKSPLHQPSFAANAKQQQQQQPPPPPQPQVYNISKKDFRSIVQQLTGTPSRDPPAGNNPAPHSNPPPPPRPSHPKPSSTRLQKIRPPPLTPIARPPLPPHLAPQIPYQNPRPNPIPLPNSNPIDPAFFPRPIPSPSGAGPAWAESPVTAYMRYLESSLLVSNTSRQLQPPPFPSPGLLPSPPFPPFLSPRANALPLAAPPPLLPSPGSQFVVPSPTAFLNLLSPKSPYPLLSPGFQYPPPLTPNFAFSPLGQSGILGPGPQPPPSPGLFFPPSPSGFLPILSPRWRDM